MDSLKEWTINFVKHKDIFAKKLKEYEEKKDQIVFHFKDNNKIFLVKPLLDEETFGFLKEDFSRAIVCSADRKNLKFLIDNWDKFKDAKSFTLIFANPETNAKWLLNPKTHNDICDEESLVQGLESMYENNF